MTLTFADGVAAHDDMADRDHVAAFIETRFGRLDNGQTNLNGAEHVRRHTEYHRLIEYGTTIGSAHARSLLRHLLGVLQQIYLDGPDTDTEQ